MLHDQPATEADLRALSEQGEAWALTLQAQIEGSEERLDALAARPDAPLNEIAAELRRIDVLRPQLAELRALLTGLETRARELRTAWVARQAGSAAAPRPGSGLRAGDL